jgi:hypothetical protein
MTGWGLDLMVRAFERISRRVTPDVTVLAFYTDDFRRLRPRYTGMGYALPRFELVDGKLIDLPPPGPLPAWRRLRLVQAVEQTYWRFARNQFALNGALLDRLHARTEGHSKLFVVFVPGRADTDEDQRRRGFLSEWCQRNNIPFLDLTETMKAAGVDPLHIPGNYHWNRRGHGLLAPQFSDSSARGDWLGERISRRTATMPVVAGPQPDEYRHWQPRRSREEHDHRPPACRYDFASRREARKIKALCART